MEQSSPKESNKLALFDFDGTLTRHDTMFAFVEFAKGKSKLLWSLIALAPILFLNKIGQYPSEKAKQRFLKFHFDGMSRTELEALGTTFCADELPRLFREDALEKLHFHRSKGHEVYVVTASLDIWVQPWLDTQNLKGICTVAAWDDDAFHGEFAGPNCNGPEKARRLQEEVDLSMFERIYAYGDTKGDQEMLALAHRKYYRKFS
ncbi:MAG TPA: HAD-IB family hydrolase [Bacteroidia bacterium]|nr:HAD-IB family hydrolase [Bacteroidia bacterium]